MQSKMGNWGPKLAKQQQQHSSNDLDKPGAQKQAPSFLGGEEQHRGGKEQRVVLVSEAIFSKKKRTNISAESNKNKTRKDQKVCKISRMYQIIDRINGYNILEQFYFNLKSTR
uniref:Uncharacterized protein n=1 Tax=Arundo donax TaxID=35708 RepID=A0A0A9CUQ1_ARUDO